MSPPRLQAHAVELIYGNSDVLYHRFERDHGDESERRSLQDANESYAPDIRKWLDVFADGQTLRAPLSAPRNAFMQFLAAWMQGKGDMNRSFARLSEYRTLLMNARPEVDRLLRGTGGGEGQPSAPPQPTPGPTKQDLQALQEVVEATKVAVENFQRYLGHPDPMAAKAIRTAVTEISSELKRDWSLAALADLRVPTGTWAMFVRRYDGGQRLARDGFEMLEEFQTHIINANRALVRAGA